jgi:hypothetical protein
MSLDKEKIKESYKKNYNIEFLGFDDLSFKDSIEYLREKMQFEFILSEVGVSTLYDDLVRDNINDIPIDTLFLSIFKGNVKPAFLTLYYL